MSGPNNRRSADRRWQNAEVVFEIIDRNRRIAEVMAETARLHGGGPDLEEAKYYFWVRALEHLHPHPGQPGDTALASTPIMKGSSEVTTRFFGRTHRLERRNGHLLAEVELNLNQLPAAKLREAFQKAGRLALRQMRNSDLRLAGTLIDSEVSSDSVVSLRLAVTDPAAMAKLGSRTYSGIVLTFDEGEVADISLVDAPVDFVGEFAKRSPQVLAKVFSNESETMSKLLKKAKKMSKKTGYPVADCADALAKVRRGQVIPMGLAKAFQEQQAAAELTGRRDVDQLAAKARQARATDAVSVELIKAIRGNPQNRLFGPRYDHR